jgi:alpha-glucosidase (family GH31 glycosyl hydrolase)
MGADQASLVPPPRLRWLASNALRITHAAGGEIPAPDRPWLKDVLLPTQPPEQGEEELRVEISPEAGIKVPGNKFAVITDPDNKFTGITDPGYKTGSGNPCPIRVLAPDGSLLFAEMAPPRLDMRRLVPYLSIEPTQVRLRCGLRRIQGGVRLRLGIEPGEAFYGWGEQFNAFRRTTGGLRLKIRDAIAQLQGGGETYSAIPFFLSSRGYGFWLLNSHTSRWKIDPSRGVLEIEAEGPGADYILIYGPTFKRILQTYTVLTGRPPFLPRWAFGLWVTSYPQGDQKSVIRHVQEHRKRSIPLEAVILDYHWEEAFHNFRWRRSLVPDPDGLIASLRSLGVRLGLIQTPFVNCRNRPLQKFVLNRLAHNLPPGLEKDDERALPEYAEARERGYLAHEKAGWWFGEGGMLDFANPQAADWWNSKMRPLYEQGVAFFKNDDGEYLPEDSYSANGMRGDEYHNIYGFYYGRALSEGMASLGRRPLIYARSTWAGSQRYPALFLGDQKPTFEGLRSTLRAGLNMSLMGFAYWTPDVFGLDGKTTLETHMRYAQWALMAPVARYFWRPPEIDDTRFPWSHGAKAEENFRRYTNLRYRLLPYYTTLAWEAWQSGLPLMRPLVLEFQGEERLAEVYDQVMLGDKLMLCPVVEAEATRRPIRLPAGEGDHQGGGQHVPQWHDFWSTQSWEGEEEIDYPAPLERLPILVRGGTILPMGPAMQFIPDDHCFDPLIFHVWPPYPAQGFLYEDDGRSLDYQREAYSLIYVMAEGDASLLRVHLAAAEGRFEGQPQTRTVEIILHRSTAPAAVRVNGSPMQDWRYDPVAQELTIEVGYAIDQDLDVEVSALA